MTLWLLLALCSALFLGGYEVSRKSALIQNAPLPVLLSATLGGWLSLSLALVVGAGQSSALRIGFFLEPLSLGQHLYVVVKAAIVTVSWVFAYISVKHLPITVAGPLRALSPALTVLGALLFFGESPNEKQWVGIFVIFLGYMAFARVGRKEGISFVRSKWIWLLILGTSVGAMSGLYDKYLLQRISFQPTTLQFWFVTYAAAMQGVLVALWWVPNRKKGEPFRLVWTAPLAGALLVFADQFYFRALAEQEALVSVVALVRRSSAIVSFGLGSFLFKDRFVRNKSAALAIVLLGLFILLFGR